MTLFFFPPDPAALRRTFRRRVINTHNFIFCSRVVNKKLTPALKDEKVSGFLSRGTTVYNFSLILGGPKEKKKFCYILSFSNKGSGIIH